MSIQDENFDLVRQALKLDLRCWVLNNEMICSMNEVAQISSGFLLNYLKALSKFIEMWIEAKNSDI